MRDAIPVYVHLLRAKDLIDRDYAQPLDAAALARAAHASTAHLSRSFKRTFGESPHQYLLRRRIERAKELLRSTNRSMTEISLDVGFRSLGSFSTGLRALVGESPSDYARRWHATAAPAIPGCFTFDAHPARWIEQFSRSGRAGPGLASAGQATTGGPPDDHRALPHHDLGARPG